MRNRLLVMLVSVFGGCGRLDAVVTEKLPPRLTITHTCMMPAELYLPAASPAPLSWCPVHGDTLLSFTANGDWAYTFTCTLDGVAADPVPLSVALTSDKRTDVVVAHFPEVGTWTCRSKDTTDAYSVDIGAPPSCVASSPLVGLTLDEGQAYALQATCACFAPGADEAATAEALPVAATLAVTLGTTSPDDLQLSEDSEVQVMNEGTFGLDWSCALGPFPVSEGMFELKAARPLHLDCALNRDAVTVATSAQVLCTMDPTASPVSLHASAGGEQFFSSDGTGPWTIPLDALVLATGAPSTLDLEVTATNAFTQESVPLSVDVRPMDPVGAGIHMNVDSTLVATDALQPAGPVFTWREVVALDTQSDATLLSLGSSTEFVALSVTGSMLTAELRGRINGALQPVETLSMPIRRGQLHEVSLRADGASVALGLDGVFVSRALGLRFETLVDAPLVVGPAPFSTIYSLAVSARRDAGPDLVVLEPCADPELSRGPACLESVALAPRVYDVGETLHTHLGTFSVENVSVEVR